MEWNEWRGSRDAQSTLVSVLRARAEEEPDRPILRFLGDRDAESVVTYSQLDRRARAIAARLQEQGASGERALVLHDPGEDYVTALFGCLYAGAVAVPVYPPRFNRPMARLGSIVGDSRARFALSSERIIAQFGAATGEAVAAFSSVTWLASDSVARSAESDAYRPEVIAPDALALLQYTSGSTGEPKGVMLSHQHFLRNIEALAERGQADPTDRWVTWLPPYHDMGLIGGILFPLCTGTEVVLLSPAAFLLKPVRWLSAISRFKATVSGGPNFAFDLCVRRVSPAQRATLDLSSWRMAFCGAERVRAESLEAFAEAFGSAGFRRSSLVPCYGLAEATLGVTLGAPGKPLAVQTLDLGALSQGRVEAPKPGLTPRQLVGCGAPLPGCEVSIVHPETRARCADRVMGEIWVTGPSIAGGYWGKQEATDRVFRHRLAGDPPDAPTYLRTGDLGFIDQGELYVAGRIKDLIILRGSNYYPDDLEGTIAGRHPGLWPGGVVAFAADEGGEERLVIVCEIDPTQRAKVSEIAQAVRDAIATAFALSVADVVLVAPGGIPRTSSGKVQRRLCRERWQTRELVVLGHVAGPVRGAEAPPELVHQVASVMAEVLGVAQVEADDDFFWLGGHSLVATQLASRLAETMGHEVPLQVVFEAPTPRTLAARLLEVPSTHPVSAIVKVDRSGVLPLSFSQERMWFLHQLDPQGAAYNVAGAVRIEGPLDEAVLARAFAALLERHEILRSNYPTVHGAPVLRIAATRPLPYVVADLSKEPDPAAAARARASELANAPFDIANESLLRGALYRLGPAHSVLAVSMHHLVTDAWTMGVLLDDLLGLYGALRAGRPLPPAPAVGYVDYAAWQRAELGPGRLAHELAFWRETLAGAPPLELPSDRPRRPGRSSKGALVPLALPPGLLGSLRELGAAHGATPFMVMLAAFDAVLQRHTGQGDLVVGVPVAGRKRVASEALVGTLVNTLPVRVRFEPQVTFLELLARTRQAAIDAYAHQDLPFERLVSELGIERRPGSSPLVQVMFDFQNAPTPLKEAQALTLEPMALSRGAAQFDLSLLVFDTELGQTAGLEYSTELFDAATIERFGEHFLEVLSVIVVDPRTVLSRIPLLSASERAAVLLESRATCRDLAPAGLVHRRFAERALESPEATAVVDGAGEMTYGELRARAQALAAQLVALGAGPGERVAIYLERTRDLVVALLAVLESGAAYVPLDPRHPPLRVGYVLEHAQPRLILTLARLRAQLGEHPASRVIALDDEAPPAAQAEVPEDEQARAAYVIYTSGSTGRPKGVEVSVGALANFLRSMERMPGLGRGDRLVSVTTIAFDIAGLELFLPLVTGACVYLAPADVVADGRRLADLLAKVSPRLVQATPATWRMLIEAGWRGDATLKVLCGGEAMAPELGRQLLERAGEVWNMYGPTETTIWSTLHRVVPGDDPIPIGRPIDETPVYVLDEHQALCPFGVAGELCIGGVGVANGYFRRDDLTAERFLPDPFGPPGSRLYRTGDLGRLRRDGVLEHLGRLDHQIKIRGFRIEPAEIETVLKESPKVMEALVIAREDRPGDLRLVAYFVPAGAEPVPASELRGVLERRLPEYMIPSAFVALEALPKTPNGKIDRARLPPPAAEHAAALSEHVGPRTQTEVRITRIWEEVLGVAQPSVRASFFVLGGHSLLAVQVFARIEREFGVELPISTLFHGPTIEHLAERVDEGRPDQTGFRYLVPIQPKGAETPLFCVHGAGGNVLHLVTLARHLGPARPFYGFQSEGLDGRTAPSSRIEDMAQAYLAELRQVQPRGPYLLSGYCAGGVVAFEMARRLRDEGETVALVAMLDTYRPGIDLRPGVRALRRKGLAAGGVGYLVRGVARWLTRALDTLRLNWRVRGHRLVGAAVPLELRDHWLTRAFFGALKRYRPQRYSGKVTVFRAENVNPILGLVGPELGWGSLAEAGVEVHDVPGDHDTLVEEPHVSELARQLTECLPAAHR